MAKRKKSRQIICKRNKYPRRDVSVESLQLRGIFPDQVWVMILSQVRDYDHFTRIQCSSPHFASIVRTFRVAALLPTVAKVLYNRFNIECNPEKLNLFRKLRSVCRDWKRTVDSIFQSIDHHQLKVFDQENSNDYIHNFSQKGCEFFKNVNDISDCMERYSVWHQNTPQQNPFLFRSIKIKFRSLNNPVQIQLFINRMLELLDIYGEHVWYLQFQNVILQSQEQLTYMAGLVEILRKMPNLRALKFYGNTFEYPTKLLDKKAIEDYFEQNPLPLLQNLEILDCSNLPSIFSLGLLKKNQNTIRQLSEQYKTNIQSVYLPNLSTLRLVLENTTKKLETYATHSRITRLKLDATCLSGPDSWMNLFRSLEQHCSKTLLELCVKMPTSSHLIIPEKLEFEKLKYFSFRLSDANLVPLDFLLTLQHSVEQISIGWSGRTLEYRQLVNSKGGDVLQLYPFRNELYKSNIWKLLPKLKILKLVQYNGYIAAKVCTREDWRAYKTTCNM